jgi:hypothetical protein
MRHAGSAALASLSPILERLRRYGELTERSPGVFYRKGRAFLHFHEDPAGLFADIRSENAGDFDRIPVGDVTGLSDIVQAVEARLSRPA